MKILTSVFITLLFLFVSLSPSFAEFNSLEKKAKVLALIENNYIEGESVEVLSEEKLPSIKSKATLILKSIDPVDFKSIETHFERYLPRDKNSNGKTIIIIPPTGGATALDRLNAQRFASDGFTAYVLDSADFSIDEPLDLGLHDRAALKMISIIKHILSYVNPKTNHDVGFLGSSLGALYCSLIFSIDSRVNTAFLLVPGGDLPEINATSKLDKLRYLKKLRTKFYGYKSDDEYILALREVNIIDPLLFAENHKETGKNLHIVFSVDDETVPTKNQQKLISAFGHPEITVYKKNHVGTIVQSSLFDYDKMKHFFHRNLWP